MKTSGKNKNSQLTADDELHGTVLSVDSREEADFINWCCEAAGLSVIKDFEYQPDSFLLFDGAKYRDAKNKERTMFRPHEYTCDFIVAFDPSAYPDLAAEFKTPYSDMSCDAVSAYIDTKGTFNPNSRSFSTDRKWVWDKYGKYVHEVVPVKFFAKFGVPKKSFYSNKTKKARKMYKGMKSIESVFKN